METSATNPENDSASAEAPLPYAVEVLEQWRPDSVVASKDALRELTLTIARENIREACLVLRDAGYNFLADVTCLDMYPSEPRFHVIYHLLSHGRKERLRLKVPVSGEDAAVDSITPVWPSANFYEREVFDLFGVRFGEHPNLRRIMMPEDWKGHPLRKDYPVEGYR
jgi:NADH-quinone oxidoreductase subunit C